MTQGSKLEKSQARGTAGWCSRSCGLCVRERQTEIQRPQTETEREGREEAGKDSELGGEAKKKDWGPLGGLHPPSQGTRASLLGSEETTQCVKSCVLESGF